MKVQYVTPSGEHKYNFISAQRFVRLSEIVYFLNDWRLVNFFLHICVLNTITNNSLAILLK